MADEKKKGFWVFIGAIIVGIFGVFVFHKLWNWFISPLGVDEIGFAHAFGLCLIISLVKGITYVDKSNLEPSKQILNNFGFLTIALTFGYISKSFM